MFKYNAKPNGLEVSIHTQSMGKHFEMKSDGSMKK
jgi:hypothetical protein